MYNLHCSVFFYYSHSIVLSKRFQKHVETLNKWSGDKILHYCIHESSRMVGINGNTQQQQTVKQRKENIASLATWSVRQLQNKRLY